MITFGKQKDNLKEKARYLRKNSTLSEALLWNKLKNKQIDGLDFDRQKVINNRYIIDFYCPASKLAIEIDGVSHDNKRAYDIERHNYLTGLGIKLLHFADDDVKNHIDEILDDIEKYSASTTPALCATPSPAKGNFGRCQSVTTG